MQIEKKNESYAKSANKGRKKVVFEPGDWVWIHMRKERFPSQRKSKLQPRGDGPFQVLSRINDNAYKIELPSEYGVSDTFNVADLSPFDVGDDDINSRSNSFQERGNDEDTIQDISDAIQSLGGPMTRARARRVNDALVHFIIKSIEGPAQIEEGLAQVEEKEPKFVFIIQACDSGTIKHKKSGK